MPIYEYSCHNGCEPFEEVTSMTTYRERGPLTTCPQCDQETLERVFSPLAVWSTGPKTLGSLGEANLKKLDSRQREIYEAKERQARGPDVQQLVRDVLTGKRK